MSRTNETKSSPMIEYVELTYTLGDIRAQEAAEIEDRRREGERLPFGYCVTS